MKNNKPQINIPRVQKQDENLYVFEKSVEIDKERLYAIGKSLENERNKAGIILGFIILAFITSIDYIEKNKFLSIKIFIISFFLLAIIFSLLTFVSVKMKGGIKTGGNFKRSWEDKEKFLLFQHESLMEIVNEQKEYLRKNRENIKFSAISIFGIVLLLIVSIFI
jgi:hypothetical protein